MPIIPKKVDQLFSQWSDYFKLEHKFNVVFQFMEAIAAIAFGAMISRPFSELTRIEWFVLIAFGVVFLILFLRKSLRERFFPLAAIGETKATMDLEDRDRALNRKRNIDKYFDEAVQALNSNTCNYSGSAVEEYLCDSSLEEGFKSVFRPYLDNPPFLFNTPLSRFTVGITLEDVSQLPPNFEMGEKRVELWSSSPVTICAKDDLGMSKYFLNDMLWNETFEGIAFHFQKQIQDTFKHSKFIANNFSHDNVDYTMITAPVPQVCEDAGNRGVLFIISEELPVPDDLSDISIIFSRLFSNWLSKYEDCVAGRIHRSNQLFQEKTGTANIAALLEDTKVEQPATGLIPHEQVEQRKSANN